MRVGQDHMTLESPFELSKSYTPDKQLISMMCHRNWGREIHERETGFEELWP